VSGGRRGESVVTGPGRDALRAVETGLARFTLLALVVYVPAETWVSWSRGLSSPFYLVDAIAMVLLGAGAWRSLRARPRRAPELLAAAYGWAASNGWRATFGRVGAVRAGEPLDHGIVELWVVAVASAIALGCLALSIVLVVRRDRGGVA
jgi:hypothetical protein